MLAAILYEMLAGRPAFTGNVTVGSDRVSNLGWFRASGGGEFTGRRSGFGTSADRAAAPP